MQKSPGGLMTALIPVFGLAFLFLCSSCRPTLHPGHAFSGCLHLEAPTEDRTVSPASLNPARTVVLQAEYRHWRLCLAQSHSAPSGAERAQWRVSLRGAVGNYNAVACGTDPSAFRSCRLPRHL